MDTHLYSRVLVTHMYLAATEGCLYAHLLCWIRAQLTSTTNRRQCRKFRISHSLPFPHPTGKSATESLYFIYFKVVFQHSTSPHCCLSSGRRTAIASIITTAVLNNFHLLHSCITTRKETNLLVSGWEICCCCYCYCLLLLFLLVFWLFFLFMKLSTH